MSSPSMSDAEIVRLLSEGKGVGEIAKMAGVSKSAISQRKKKLTKKTHALMDVKNRALVTQQDLDARQQMLDINRMVLEDVTELREMQKDGTDKLDFKSIIDLKLKHYKEVLNQIKALSDITLAWDQEAYRRDKDQQKKLFRFIFSDVLDENQRHKVREHIAKLKESEDMESYDG